jgi:hypothetical protein
MTAEMMAVTDAAIAAMTDAMTDATTAVMTDAITVKARVMAIATTGGAMINQLTTLPVAFDTERSAHEALPTSF